MDCSLYTERLCEIYDKPSYTELVYEGSAFREMCIGVKASHRNMQGNASIVFLVTVQASWALH